MYTLHKSTAAKQYIDVDMRVHVAEDKVPSCLCSRSDMFIREAARGEAIGAVRCTGLMARKLTGSYPALYDTGINGRFICNSKPGHIARARARRPRPGPPPTTATPPAVAPLSLRLFYCT
ncbi:hypothetical protein EVAR_9018_1 [Eumeta japonica]|uniref:Uncharacterized protein n=1 Tax=Eumeta variegata TaxID=151549 RepID=A0A4C1TWZ3_EUMVA|nr:hypothetical protein EVAR_9018_1 [Eumeta japonica]